MEQEILVDKDIVLRQRNVRNAKLIFSIVERNREYLGKWLPWAITDKSSADTKRYLKSCANKDIMFGVFSYEIWFQEQLVGLLGFQSGSRFHKTAQIGYWLDETAAGNGIMTKACRAIIDRAYKTTDVNRLSILVAVENHRSAAIPARLGFSYEGINRDGIRHFDEFRDIKVFSMLRKEWKYL